MKIAAAGAGALIMVTFLAVSFPPERTLHLFVSNQSIDQPLVNLTLAVDGHAAVQQSFHIADGHNYTRFDLRVSRGLIRAQADFPPARAEATLYPFGERWVVVSYWWTNPGPAGFSIPAITIAEFSAEPAFG